MKNKYAIARSLMESALPPDRVSIFEDDEADVDIDIEPIRRGEGGRKYVSRDVRMNRRQRQMKSREKPLGAGPEDEIDVDLGALGEADDDPLNMTFGPWSAGYEDQVAELRKMQRGRGRAPGRGGRRRRRPLDGKGPEGGGPRTGRGAGYCPAGIDDDDDDGMIDVDPRNESVGTAIAKGAEVVGDVAKGVVKGTGTIAKKVASPVVSVAGDVVRAAGTGVSAAGKALDDDGTVASADDEDSQKNESIRVPAFLVARVLRSI